MRDSDTPFRASLLEKSSRSDRALKPAIATLCVQGVSTRREKQPKLVAWVEENLPEDFTVFDLPDAHRWKPRTSNACETLNSQIKRRTRVVGRCPEKNHCNDSSPPSLSKSPESGNPENPTSTRKTNRK